MGPLWLARPADGGVAARSILPNCLTSLGACRRPIHRPTRSVAEAFKARAPGMPTATLVTYARGLRAKLSAGGRFITAMPKSVLRHGDDRHALKELAVDIPIRPWAVAVLTLKNRTLSPIVERFIECARDVAKSMET